MITVRSILQNTLVKDCAFDKKQVTRIMHPRRKRNLNNTCSNDRKCDGTLKDGSFVITRVLKQHLKQNVRLKKSVCLLKEGVGVCINKTKTLCPELLHSCGENLKLELALGKLAGP